MKLVVIGGVACGPKAASRVRRLDPEAEIVVVEKDLFFSYGGCGLPYYIMGEVSDLDELRKTPVGVIRDEAFFKAVKNIQIMSGTEAIAVDTAKKQVTVKNLASGEEKILEYDKLVMATGSTPQKAGLPGEDLVGVTGLTNPDETKAIMAGLADGKVKKAVIIGAGYIGMEATEALASRGVEVTLLIRRDRPLPRMLDYEMAAPVMAELKAKGVNVVTGVKPIRIVDDGNGVACGVETDKGVYDADLVLNALGFKPNSKLAAAAGLKINEDGSIFVNQQLQTSDPDIYSGGDCIDNVNVVSGLWGHTPLGDLANIHGRIIANNICGKEDKFGGITGTAVVKIFGVNAGSTGLSEEKAVAAGLEPISILTPGSDIAHYLPMKEQIMIKLVADKNSGKLLGAQIVGAGDVAKRLDTLAVALKAGMGIDELAELDLAYAPHFSPAMDNLLTACDIMRNKLDGLGRGYNPVLVKKMLDAGEDFVLLDVRSPAEFAEVRLPLPNVVHIPLGKLRERAGELPKDKLILGFCKISLRGYEAQRVLDGLGFPKTGYLDGGVVAWPYAKEVGPKK